MTIHKKFYVHIKQDLETREKSDSGLLLCYELVSRSWISFEEHPLRKALASRCGGLRMRRDKTAQYQRQHIYVHVFNSISYSVPRVTRVEPTLILMGCDEIKGYARNTVYWNSHYNFGVIKNLLKAMRDLSFQIADYMIVLIL